MSICSFIDCTISTFLFVCAAVTDEEKMVSVKEGDSVILKTDAEIRRDDQILWTFGPQETLIAEIKSETREITTFDCAEGRFRDKLKLDKTGSLTITNITTEHIGVYKLQTISSRGTSYQRFIVTVRREYLRSFSIIMSCSMAVISHIKLYKLP